MVFIYSKIVLTVDFLNVSNQILNFCILSIRTDITQRLAHWKRFELSMIWTKFWYDKETSGMKQNIFKTKKNYLPTLFF